MAYFKITNFSGIAPQISPRLLAEDLAQTAQDVNVESGRLVPVTTNDTTIYDLDDANRTTIYKYDYWTGSTAYAQWLEWDDDVDVVAGPVAGSTDDRVYWTGEGGTTGSTAYPRMAIDSDVYTGSGSYPRASWRLGIPAPVNEIRSVVASTIVGGTAMVFNGATAVDPTADTITLSQTNYDKLAAGEPVRYDDGGGTTIVGLADATVYYVIKVAETTTVKLASGTGASTTATVSVAVSSSTAVILKENNEDIVVGMTVTGTGISGTSLVSAIGDTSLTLNGAQSISADVVLTFSPTIVDITGDGAGAAHSLTPAEDPQQTKYSTAYVYTFVSPYGEEGPPSKASAVFDMVDGQTINISNMDTTFPSAVGTTNIKTTGMFKRLYRSNTGSNTTAFQLVQDNIPLNAATTTESQDNDQLAEIIPSTYWIGPPNENTADYPDGPMLGLTAMPGGILAGFRGKRLYFSEPYMPHAWPVSYRATIEEEIVAIGMAGNGLIVTTKGTPYLVAGADPRSMSIVRIEAAQACLSKRSLVDMGPYIMYASPDGLVVAAGTDVKVATEGMITPKQWQADYHPAYIKGYLWQGRYVGLFTNTDANPDVFGGFIFDPRAGKNAFIELTQVSATDAAGGFTDPDDNELYLLINAEIVKFQGTATNKTFTWKSKEFVTKKPTSMGFLKVDAEAFPVTLKVYGDGTLFYTATITISGTQHSVSGSYVNAAGSTVAFPSSGSTPIPEPILRLPARTFNTFSIEISSATIVNEVCISTEIDEIREL